MSNSIKGGSLKTSQGMSKILTNDLKDVAGDINLFSVSNADYILSGDTGLIKLTMF